MKKLIAVSLVLIALCAPTALLPESFVIVRAISKEANYIQFSDYLTPGFLAKARISLYGLSSCTYFMKGDSEPHYFTNLLTAAHSSPNTDAELVRKYLATLQRHGCSYESLDSTGLTALHSAILFKDYALVEFFLKNGASLTTRIQRPGQKAHGKNAEEFALLLFQIEPHEHRAAILERLNNTSTR